MAASGTVIDVRPYWRQIRQVSREMVIRQELQALEESSQGKTLERVKLLQSLIRER